MVVHYGGMTCAQHPPVPDFVRACHQSDVDSQRVNWRPTPFWRKILRDHPTLLADLEAEVSLHGRLTRNFVKRRDDPIELFLAMMAWGRAWRSAPSAGSSSRLTNATRLVTGGCDDPRADPPFWSGLGVQSDCINGAQNWWVCAAR